MAVDVNNKSEEIEEIDKVSGEVIEEKEAEEKEAATKSQSVMKEIWDWVKTIVVAIVCAVFITQFVIVNARVPSASMETTIMTGDRLIANRLSYKFSDPKRYDIVVFKFPDDESVLYIKRIIGLPGEKVTIRDNQVYINDSTTPLDTSFLHEPMVTEDDTYYVPDDSYFMMGDNRNNSADSRFWNNKYVKRDKIEGKAVFRYFPFNSMGLLTNK